MSPTNASSERAVISGAGASGLLHALALRAAGVRVAAVWDPDPSRARALAEATSARAAQSFDELASEGADLACVCSPPSVHAFQAERLSPASRLVLVEKPVGVREADLARLLELPHAVPIVQWRAGRGLRVLRLAIARGELGPRPVASLDLAWQRDDAYFRAREATWGCGALLSIGIHAIDAITWALGRRIESVSGLTMARDGVSGETGAVAILHYAGGALVSLRLSLDGGADATRFTVCGAGVTATLGGGEADPTASSVTWHARDASTRRRLAALERAAGGAGGPPLLVPYLADVLAGLRDGEAPGDSERIPSIRGTLDAHEAALRLAAAR